ncbi:MAG: DUF6362 family protein [Pseudomonadota bacterium]
MSHPDDITAAEIMERLTEAARTLRRLPAVKGPHEHRSHWPDYVHAAQEAYGYSGVGRIRITPSPRDIDAMDEAIPWLQLMADDDARIAWARANRTPWWKIGAIAGCDPRTAQRRLMEALLKTAATLNERKAG